LPDDAEILTTYKNYLTNPHDLNDHLDIISFFKTDLYINTKVAMSNSNNFKTNDKIDMADAEWKHIQKLFNYTKSKPTTTLELKPIIIQMIKSIMVNNIINNMELKQIKLYSVNIHLIKMS
jgi:hypothetical protein